MFKYTYMIYFIFNGITILCSNFYDLFDIKYVVFGSLIPSIISYINILIIQYLKLKYNDSIVLKFNMLQFVFKTLFMLLMTYLGVKILYLNSGIFVSILCFTWFLFHIIEGLYTKSISN